ncbi:MAG: response regulator transcription factor, partial [Chloroflexia bacterium]|nr:response regulator transcription factor [Chloroflexia bacterium]
AATAEALAVGGAEARTPASPAALPHSLTKREPEVLALLGEGLSNREIGDRLFISPTTAARHVANVFAKLGVDTRAKAAAYAHRHGLA